MLPITADILSSSACKYAGKSSGLLGTGDLVYLILIHQLPLLPVGLQCISTLANDHVFHQ
jgi:hypothetical protein